MISFGKISLRPLHDMHMPALWDILREWPEQLFLLEDVLASEQLFITWFKTVAKDGLTCFDSGRIVGCAYLDHIYRGAYATVNIFKKRGYANPRVVAGICKKGLPYFFEQHDLEKLVGLVPTGVTSSLNLAKRLGFTTVGTVRHHAKRNGKWEDCIWIEILREEVFDAKAHV